MSYIHAVKCDGCGSTQETTHIDDGVPAGWHLVAVMDRQGGWDDANEWAYCNIQCVLKGTKKRMKIEES